MHIPDGYLGPATAGTLYGAVLPFWYIASRKLRRVFTGRLVPTMALMSAFCFVIQMINVPLPGGTTGHAVGASLAAIVLGPWPAVISLSVALVIQALFFGDGGITTLGANCFNMAVVQVFTAYLLFRFFASGAKTPRGYAFAAGAAGYISLNVAALFTGIELGLQPHIAHAVDGTPLYAPYPLHISVPAMVLSHLVAGFAEAVLSGAAILYLIRTAPDMLQPRFSNTDGALAPSQRQIRAMWILTAVLIVITPLGLLAPDTAWGEWSSEQLRNMGLGFVPQGIRRWEGLWKSLLSDYSVPGLGENTGYIVSAIAGVLFILAIFGVVKIAARKAAQK
jgi:cobalt/nickel transport system permease protein